ncbi:hypothetical protein [Kluyvera georgiana]|uniref:HofO family protein n=1 Tax=Kluyvera georgiana TaxID=73098 RepID=UPI0023029A91|nr:hypothetical protein [Kluyvera georgiana]MDA8492053.1 hypothetical protein [Kluyvera georgiana]
MRLPDGGRAVSRLNALRLAGLMALLAGCGLCFYMMKQVNLTFEKGNEARQRQHAQYVAGWQRLMPLRVLPEGAESAVPPVVAFSPAAFQQAGAKLVSWQPSDKGGELVLDTPWLQVVSTFSLLAERDMQVAAFALTGENGTLRFTMRLVHDDEP